MMVDGVNEDTPEVKAEGRWELLRYFFFRGWKAVDADGSWYDAPGKLVEGLHVWVGF